MPKLLNVREYETAARPLLDPVYHDYFAGGAGDEITVGENEAAFARIGLIPRVLRGAGPPDLKTRLLGTPATMPVMIAPTGFHRLAHPEGERATARAAAAAGAIMIVAMVSTVSVEDIAAEARKVSGRDPRLWFQLYIQPDLGFTETIVRRAEDAGCRALVVTVDSPVFGRRERDDRNDFHDLPPGLRCENLRDDATSGIRQVVMSPEISWRHLDWLREHTDLPIVLKGILHPQDAREAVDGGMGGVIVSNHGGRQLDTTPATIDRLPLIADAVEGRIPVLLDGGIRRGTDVVKALALGADAVAVGRPILWGLAVEGEAGVRDILELLRTELEHTLALCGCPSPRAATQDLLTPLAPAVPPALRTPSTAHNGNALREPAVRNLTDAR